jgi:hypothetical protein
MKSSWDVSAARSLAGKNKDDAEARGRRNDAESELVPFWEVQGYTPYVFERVWKWLRLWRLQKYRKRECGSDWKDGG